jgi:cytoskeletal protein RodZ
MVTLKNNQTGFGAIEILMLVVIVILIGAAGWIVLKDQNKAQTIKKNSKVSSSTNGSNSNGPNQKQYNGWQSFCSSYGGLCLKYPSNWKFSQATYTPGQSSTGQEVNAISSPSTNVTVSYMPSAQVSGTRRQEVIKVVGLTATNISNIEVVKLIDQLSGPTQYAVEDYVSLTSAAHTLNNTDLPFTLGATINATFEPPYHQFTNPQRPSDIGQQLLAITVNNGNAGNNLFNTNADAQAWLNSSEVQTAGQILDSVTYSQ